VGGGDKGREGETEEGREIEGQRGKQRWSQRVVLLFVASFINIYVKFIKDSKMGNANVSSTI
jgi:hypothetical protein